MRVASCAIADFLRTGDVNRRLNTDSALSQTWCETSAGTDIFTNTYQGLD